MAPILRSRSVPLAELNGLRSDPAALSPSCLPALVNNWRSSPYGRQMWARLTLMNMKTDAVTATSFPAKFLPVKATNVISEGILALPFEIGIYKLLAPVVGNPADSFNRFHCISTTTKEKFICKVILQDDPRTSMYWSAQSRLQNVTGVDQVVSLINKSFTIPGEYERSQNCSFIFYKDRVDHKSLDQIIRARGSFVEADARTIFRQVAELVDACHRNGVALREIQLRRLMLGCENNGERKLTLASLDDCVVFGLNDSAKMNYSTPYYLSPEFISRRSKDTRLSLLKVDIWRLGIILFACVMGKYPFQDIDPNRMMLKITACDFGPLPRHFSNDLKTLLSTLLNVKPEDRPLISEVLNHPWLQREQNENLYGSVSTNQGEKRDIPNSS